MLHQHHVGAAAPGSVTPELTTPRSESETPGKVGTGQALQINNDDNEQILGQAGGERKASERMRAEAAMAGCGLYLLAGGGYLLTRHGMAKECPDLRAVASLLSRLGGAR